MSLSSGHIINKFLLQGEFWHFESFIDLSFVFLSSQIVVILTSARSWIFPSLDLGPAESEEMSNFTFHPSKSKTGNSCSRGVAEISWDVPSGPLVPSGPDVPRIEARTVACHRIEQL